MAAKSGLSKRKLGEIIRRVVKVAQPEKIILFGSAARGEMRPNSDVDLLVVKPEPSNPPPEGERSGSG